MSIDGSSPLSSEDQFALLLTQSQSRIFGFLMKRLANREQATEVLQETNLVLLMKKKEFIPGTDFIAWSCTVAHFQVLAFRKRQSRDRLVFDEGVMELLIDSEPPDRQEAMEERRAALHQCVDRLNAQERFVLELRYGQGKSINDIAQGLCVSVNAMRIRLHRIRQLLLACVQSRTMGAT